jgi:hypothetical protein
MQIEFREPNEVDRDQIAKWIEKDSNPQHNGVSPDFWLPEVDEQGNKTDKGTKCLAVMNGEGKVLFYLRLENIMRCYIQFPPDAERDQLETAVGLKGAFLTVASGAKATGYREMIFDSKSEGLIRLFSKFGFKPAEDNYLVRL